jgi:hypothetical protein
MRAAILPVVVLTVSGCATTASHEPQAHQPTPGYVCTVRLDDRKTSETWLRADGSVFSSRWDWAWDSDFATGLRLWVTHSTGRDVNPNSFPVAVISSNPTPFDPKRAERSRLALTNQPGTDWLNFNFAIAKSDPPRRGSPPQSLWISWSDLVAYFEGSPALYLLTLDTKDSSVTSRAIPRSLIVNADSDIKTMAQQMEVKVADYAAQCDAVDDIDPAPDILV